LDFAHSIDSGLAKDLLTRLDDDEARKEPLLKRLESNAKRKELAKNPDSTEFDTMDDEQVVDVCRENLGSLNANRIPIKPVEDFLKLNRRAKGMRMVDAYWAWAWIAENAVRRRSLAPTEKLCSKLFEAAARASEIGQALIGRIPTHSHLADFESGTIHAGERDRFFSRIKDWAQEQDGQTILLSDPYFAPTDVDILKLMSEVAPHAQFRVLTSKEQIKKKQISEPEDSFRDAWESISDVEPPTVEVGIVGYGSDGKHPIHDRWIVTKSAGLKIGSSVNSTGLSRTSDVSLMTTADSSSKFGEISQYFDQPPRTHNGERLTLSTLRL
jgi:hypothetical protein